MPISVICPGCHSRFQVSEKFAGKQGNCPKCKGVITVPTADQEVKIHAPAESGGVKDSTGRPVTKPISRDETRLNPTVAVAIGAAVLVTLGLAWLIGRAAQTEEGTTVVSPVVLGAGAVLLALPLVLAGYSFLRDDELEPYRGKELWIRATICALLYAGLWGVYDLLSNHFGLLSSDSTQAWVFAAPAFLAVGGGIAFASLDLEFGSAVFHYAFYLGITLLLRKVMGLPLL